MMEVRAEIAGSVLHIITAEGDHVREGDTLVILESMKMEIPVLADNPGTISSLHVTDGEIVREDSLLAVIGEPRPSLIATRKTAPAITLHPAAAAALARPRRLIHTNCQVPPDFRDRDHDFTWTSIPGEAAAPIHPGRLSGKSTPVE